MVVNPLLINSYDNKGGAARATFRLHQGLKRRDVPSKMLVQTKVSNDGSVTRPETFGGNRLSTFRFYLDYLPIAPWYVASRGSMKNFSPAWLPDRVNQDIKKMEPDIVHLNWTVGFLNPETMSNIDAPIVWTLHDMWPFTGGCHYSGECTRYEDSCGACPALSGAPERDVSRWVWNRKRKAWKGFNPTIIAPSEWLADCARSSSLLGNERIEVIPYGIDTQKFYPENQKSAREKFGLPAKKKLVMFGSGYNTKRKGFHHLVDSLELLSERGLKEHIELVVFGSMELDDIPDLPFKIHHLGFLNDAQLRSAYSAADMTIVPSVEDNLPNIVMETLACGTPCVGFEVGGIPDMIDHKKNGYLARPGDSANLATGIEWILDKETRSLEKHARRTAKSEFDLEDIVDRHLELYEELLESYE